MSIMALENEIKQEKFKSEYNKMIVNLMFTNNWLVSREMELLRPYNLTLSQYNVLRILRGQKGKAATINLIINRMLDRMSNASRIVDRLENKGLVTRKQCKQDKRAVDVLITDKALELLSVLDKKFDEWEKSFKVISLKEAETLNTILDKIRTAQ